MADVEKKIEEVNETVEGEEVEEVEVDESERTLLQSFVYTIFNEGIDENIHLFIRITFVLLFLSLIGLLFVTNFSIHVIILLIITGALCITLEWWLNEWNIEKENRDAEEDEKDGETEEKKTK